MKIPEVTPEKPKEESADLLTAARDLGGTKIKPKIDPYTEDIYYGADD
jgi:hypothetical protein